ncbi:hypothetical protein Ciccas_010469 [Cichlidogyrus casuarinus]|uniref:Uncharacterized protein n=1 Tax=Cichlidogyrus casuarinus TaxID=1844966 RepID=A0ABD2PUD8_9PLAT
MAVRDERELTVEMVNREAPATEECSSLVEVMRDKWNEWKTEMAQHAEQRRAAKQARQQVRVQMQVEEEPEPCEETNFDPPYHLSCVEKPWVDLDSNDFTGKSIFAQLRNSINFGHSVPVIDTKEEVEEPICETKIPKHCAGNFNCED